MSFPMVALGEVVRYIKDFIQIDDLENYKRCRVQLHAQGIVLRDIVSGAEIKTKKQQVCHTGEFLVAEIDAKIGGFGIVPPELDGAIVSSHYFLFVIDKKRLDCRFLDFFIRTPYFREQVTAQGSTNYAAIRPADVLGYKIPLPPLSEQRRIVAHIEDLATKIKEARGLRKKAGEELEALAHSTLRYILETNANNPEWEFGNIPQFAEVNPSRRGKTDFSPLVPVSFVPMAAVDDITGSIVRATIRPYTEVSKGYTWFIDGDIIFARITPCMQNGKVAIAEGLANSIGFGSTEFHVLRPGPKIIGRWLYILMRNKDFKKDAEAHFKGTAGQQRVPQSFLERKVIPIPPLTEQRRIVAYLDELQAKVDALRRFQAETGAELDALLPAVLDKAFKGEM